MLIQKDHRNSAYSNSSKKYNNHRKSCSFLIKRISNGEADQKTTSHRSCQYKYPNKTFPPSVPRCFIIVSRFTQTSKRPIKIKIGGKTIIICREKSLKFLPIIMPGLNFIKNETAIKIRNIT